MKNPTISPSAPQQQPRWIDHALAAFEMESTQICRGFRASVAVNVFGVGTLLPNDLTDRPARSPTLS